MPPTPTFGQIVRIRQDRSRPGIVVEVRRSDSRVLFLDTGRSLWTPVPDLEPVEAESTRGTLEAQVTGLLELLGGIEMEFVSPAPNRHRLIVTHRSLTPDTIDQVRGALGGALHKYIIRPAGMHRLQTILEFTHGGAKRVLSH